MLSRVVIQNFKSIGEPGVDLELRPLTILVGPNGGGKSSILEAIALVAQSVGSELRLKGPLVEFSGPSDIAHKGETQRWFACEFGFDDCKDSFKVELRHDTGEGKQTLIDSNGDFTRVTLQGDRRFGLKHSVEDADGSGPARGANFMPVLLGSLFVEDSPGDTRWSPRRDLKEVRDTVDSMASQLRGSERVFFLSALRGAIPFATGTGSSPNWVGTRGEHLLDLLALVESPRYGDVRQSISKWASRFGLQKLQVGLRGPNMVAGDFVDSKLRTPLNLALASHGARQVLAVITQLFWSRPQSVMLIEEPESSLHPQAQVSLINLFAEVIKSSKQLLVTTHSSLMLLAIGQAVNKRAVEAGDIAIYDVSKVAGGTRARRLRLMPNGYIRGWVPSFKQVEQELMQGWVASLPEA